jgi:hypothetical protein
MKSFKRGMATVGALALVGAIGLVKTTPAAASSIGALRSKITGSGSSGGDPILTGSNTQTVPASSGATYVSAQTNTVTISKFCKTLEVEHADGNIYDSNNTGKESLFGMDLGIVFQNGDTPVGGVFYLGTSTTQGTIYVNGYAAVNPKSLYVNLGDISPAPTSAYLIVEGSVTATGSSQTANSTVCGLVRCLNF